MKTALDFFMAWKSPKKKSSLCKECILEEIKILTEVINANGEFFCETTLNANDRISKLISQLNEIDK